MDVLSTPIWEAVSTSGGALPLDPASRTLGSGAPAARWSIRPVGVPPNSRAFPAGPPAHDAAPDHPEAGDSKGLRRRQAPDLRGGADFA